MTDELEGSGERQGSPLPMRLDRFLKLHGLARSGGEAKVMVQGGAVKVNGETETRRARKLIAGDVVEADGRRVEVR